MAELVPDFRSPLPCVLFISLRVKAFASLSFGSQSAKEKQKLDIDPRGVGGEVAVGYWLSDKN